MSSVVDRMDVYDRYRWAESLFELRDYRGAAKVLAPVIAADPADLGGVGTTDARLLLARAYFHSAQLHAAEREARAVLAEHPTEAYALMLLGRTLQRANRPDEAAGYLAQAEAMGQSIG